jgi:hypothetical protein
MMGVSTKKGDSGFTSLLRGQRVPKYHLAIDAVGTLDEANSLLGLARASAKAKRIKRIILQIQKHLFIIASTRICSLRARGRLISPGCRSNKRSKSGENGRQDEKRENDLKSLYSKISQSPFGFDFFARMF